MMTDRMKTAKTIIQVSRDCADGYRRAVSPIDAGSEIVTAEKCAVAAGNTAWFILKALGYSNEEIEKAREKS